MTLEKAAHHGDTAATAATAKIKSVNHGEKQNQEKLLTLVFFVLSVVKAFEFAFRRVRRVAVVQMRFSG